MCGIKNSTTYIGFVNFEDNLLGKSAKKHEKKYVIVSFARYNPEPGFFKCQIWIPRRQTLRVGRDYKLPCSCLSPTPKP